jgi:hypothetical protein
VAIVRLVTDLLTVFAQDSSAFEEEVAIATTAIAQFLLRLLLALGLIIDKTARCICGGALAKVSLFVG